MKRNVLWLILVSLVAGAGVCFSEAEQEEQAEPERRRQAAPQVTKTDKEVKSHISVGPSDRYFPDSPYAKDPDTFASGWIAWQELAYWVARDKETPIIHVRDYASLGSEAISHSYSYHRPEQTLFYSYEHLNSPWADWLVIRCSNVTDKDIARGWEFVKQVSLRKSVSPTVKKQGQEISSSFSVDHAVDTYSVSPTPKKKNAWDEWDELQYLVASEPNVTTFCIRAFQEQEFETYFVADELIYDRSKDLLSVNSITGDTRGGGAGYGPQTSCSNTTDADIARGWKFIQENRECTPK